MMMVKDGVLGALAQFPCKDGSRLGTASLQRSAVTKCKILAREDLPLFGAKVLGLTARGRFLHVLMVV